LVHSIFVIFVLFLVFVHVQDFAQVVVNGIGIFSLFACMILCFTCMKLESEAQFTCVIIFQNQFWFCFNTLQEQHKTEINLRG
jgi:hypothetical protein